MAVCFDELDVVSSFSLNTFKPPDILLNEELGSNYDAPFWYQRYNGLTSLAQAQQVQSYYQQRKLPWYSSKSPHMGPASQPVNTPTSPTVQQGVLVPHPALPEPLTTPPTDSTTTSPSLTSLPDHQSAPRNYMDLTSTQTAPPTSTSPPPTIQPHCPPPIQLGTNLTITQQILVKHQLPFDCLSVEYKDEIYFKIHFIMKKVPFEVFFHRYEILEEVENDMKTFLKIINPERKIHHLRVYVDYRPQNNNLLNFV